MKPSCVESSICSMGSIKLTSSSSVNTFSSTFGCCWLCCSLLPCSIYICDGEYIFKATHFYVGWPTKIWWWWCVYGGGWSNKKNNEKPKFNQKSLKVTLSVKRTEKKTEKRPTKIVQRKTHRANELAIWSIRIHPTYCCYRRRAS